MEDLTEHIKIARSNFENKNKLFKPASFWDNATKKIIEIIQKEGLENFRDDKLMSRFFVPKYGIPANSFSEEMTDELMKLVKKEGVKKQEFAMSQFLSGYAHALSDYRVFVATNDDSIGPLLNSFSESDIGNPTEFFEFEGKRFSRSALNYILGICFLKKHLSKEDKIKNILEIGGGFGTMGEILSYTPGTQYVNFDILPTSLVSHFYLNNVVGEENINKYNEDSEKLELGNLKSNSVFHSWQIEKMEGQFDLFVNFISFQEMEPNVVQNYLFHVKRLNPKWILLRNMREGKQVKKTKTDIGVEIPIKKEDYIDMIKDKYQFIESNVHPFGYKTVDGFHSELLLFKRK